MYWLIAFVLLLVIEIITVGLTTVWFAAGALAAFIVSLITSNILVQILVFLIVSLGTLFMIRPVAVRYLNQNREKTNVDSIIGRSAIVTGAIDNLRAEGTVNVSGQEWTARSVDDSVKIAKDSRVKIIKIQGVKLIVEEEKED